MATPGSGKSEEGNKRSSLDDINAKIGERIVIDPGQFERGSAAGSIDGGSNDESGAGGTRLNKDGSVPRKRGRKPGSKTSKKASPIGVDVSGLEKILTSMHMMMAAAFSAPEMMLDDKESKELSTAIANVAQHYDTSIAPETLAWINLGAVGVSIYGTRAIAILHRKKETRKPKNPAHPVETVAAKTPSNIDPSILAHASAAG